MAETIPVLVRERWPDIPGHVGGTNLHSARRKAITADGRFWLVRKRGIFRRWQWLPVTGMFVTLHEVG